MRCGGSSTGNGWRKVYCLVERKLYASMKAFSALRISRADRSDWEWCFSNSRERASNRGSVDMDCRTASSPAANASTASMNFPLMPSEHVKSLPGRTLCTYAACCVSCTYSRWNCSGDAAMSTSARPARTACWPTALASAAIKSADSAASPGLDAPAWLYSPARSFSTRTTASRAAMRAVTAVSLAASRRASRAATVGASRDMREFTTVALAFFPSSLCRNSRNVLKNLRNLGLMTSATTKWVEMPLNDSSAWLLKYSK
mmetsp:Transcript_19373/g.49253  ORF Transcript_19373/g.49253 Transcript_19373/m.49253 type:complete len:259 (+) Transcript_19373:1885-2661(+)